ncbi:MAG: TROVE domain-containing protein [Gammaproteobacteria bacterium]|nr:TROVE domain-containing protein [Gammaproteobacteria bacterium]MDH5802880.1 TROVE domain-containing protein [Gammaproteobacteria bacterium]
MKLNTHQTKGKKNSTYTHEGAHAENLTPVQELRRTVMSCLLWENTFYESGMDIAQRLESLVAKNKAEDVAAIAVLARNDYRLRHAPLLLACALAKHAQGKVVGDTVYNVIQRADELAEILAVYWRHGRRPLSAQMKHGLARAWHKFNAYALAKYDRNGTVKLRDSLFLCHAKPKDKAQEAVWKQMIDGTLTSADTWEVNLSAGKDKKSTFERLLREKKLGYMALLRNLRNMRDADVDKQLVFKALADGAERSKALPFRFVAAANAVPKWEHAIDKAMQLAVTGMRPLRGKTVVLIDVSGSMTWKLSQKSDLNRIDAAGALAALVAGIAEDYEVHTFDTQVYEMPSRKGLALLDAIKRSGGGGTYLGKAVTRMNQLQYDRLIVITDEQSSDPVPAPKGKGYMINVASYKNGVGYGPWVHIDGFSEAVIGFMQEYETNI